MSAGAKAAWSHARTCSWACFRVASRTQVIGVWGCGDGLGEGMLPRASGWQAEGTAGE